MDDDRIPSSAKINKIDKSATEALMDTVGLIGEECDILVVIKNKKEDELTISSNCNCKEGYWLLSQARHFVLIAAMTPPQDEENEGEEGDDASSGSDEEIQGA